MEKEGRSLKPIYAFTFKLEKKTYFSSGDLRSLIFPYKFNKYSYVLAMKEG